MGKPFPPKIPDMEQTCHICKRGFVEPRGDTVVALYRQNNTRAAGIYACARHDVTGQADGTGNVKSRILYRAGHQMLH